VSDIFSTEKRSEVMSKVKSQDTKIEKSVSSWLHSKGIRFRKHVKDLPGSPDISIKKYKIALFVNGCFWHGHENCKKHTIPTTRRDFWQEKIEKNKSRDERNYQQLEKMGWHVFVLWECDLKASFESKMESVFAQMKSIML